MEGHKQNITVEIRSRQIVVRLRGTSLRAAYIKGDTPWLRLSDFAAADPDSPINTTEFRTLAWEAANASARELGWIG
jgi:transglutaminase-like putative cysteine protease